MGSEHIVCGEGCMGRVSNGTNSAGVDGGLCIKARRAVRRHRDNCTSIQSRHRNCSNYQGDDSEMASLEQDIKLKGISIGDERYGRRS